jgi:hypothetical protein
MNRVLEQGADKITEVIDEQYEVVQQFQKAQKEERDRNFAELERLASEEERRLALPKVSARSEDLPDEG